MLPCDFIWKNNNVSKVFDFWHRVFHGGYNSTLYVHNIIPQYLKYHAFTLAPVCNKKAAYTVMTPRWYVV